MFRVMGPQFAQAYMTGYTTNPRALPASQLSQLWRQVSTAAVEECSSPRAALGRALQTAGADDLVCITGSVFLAGEVRPLLIARQGEPFSLAERLSGR
jgi:dihydrofolate synthase/folylpolyglutamate synthase